MNIDGKVEGANIILELMEFPLGALLLLLLHCMLFRRRPGYICTPRETFDLAA